MTIRIFFTSSLMKFTSSLSDLSVDYTETTAEENKILRTANLTAESHKHGFGLPGVIRKNLHDF